MSPEYSYVGQEEREASPEAVEPSTPPTLSHAVDDYEDSGVEATVNYPEAEIIKTIHPDVAEPGDTITLGIKFRNVGAPSMEAEAGVFAQVWDAATGDNVDDRVVMLDHDEEEEWTFNETMPDSDWWLGFRVGHFENSDQVEDERSIEYVYIKVLTILDAVHPDEAQEGESITLGMEVEHIGEESQQVWTQIWDTDTGNTVKNWNKYMDPGDTWKWTDDYTMPGRDWNLQFRGGHFENSDVVEDEDTDKTVTLAAEAVIDDYNAPSSATPGSTVTVSGTAKNVSKVSGEFRFRLVDRDTDDEVDRTSWFTLNQNESKDRDLQGTMPDKDWNLRLNLDRKLTGSQAYKVADFTDFITANIWRRLRNWWNGLKTWQKALVAATSIGCTAGIIQKIAR